MGYSDELIHTEIEEFNKQCSVWWYNLTKQEQERFQEMADQYNARAQQALQIASYTTKMKQRKKARKERVEKKVKTVIVDDDRETPYDIEKVLLELGESDSNKKANSGGKGKNAKVERKRSKNCIKKEIGASSNNATNETTPASSERSSGDRD